MIEFNYVMSDLAPNSTRPAPTARLAKSKDKPVLDFEAALYECCRREHVLSATAIRVLHHNSDFRLTLPTVESVVLWSDFATSTRDHVLDLYRKRKRHPNVTRSQPTSWTQVLSSPVRTVQLIASPAARKITEWVVGKSDYENDFPVPAKDELKRIDWDDAVVCTRLMFELLEKMERISTDITECIALELTALPAWFDSQCNENLETNLTKLPASHFEQLLLCLQDLDVLKLVGRDGKPTLCVLLGKHRDEETAITLFDLQQSISGMEASLARWTLQSVDAKRNAKLLYEKHGSTNKEVRIELSRWKLYQTHIDNAQSTLLNLETCREAILNSVSQRESLQALQSAVQTLRTIRVENAENIVEDLQEELEHTHYDQSFMSSSIETFDDDSLLNELQNLSISDASSFVPDDSQKDSTSVLPKEIASPLEVPPGPIDSLQSTNDTINNLTTMSSGNLDSIDKQEETQSRRDQKLAISLP
jgi:hypothetical protein